MADRIKLSFALVLLLGAVGGFYVFSDQSLLIRVVGILIVFGISVAIALQTVMGQSAWSFSKEARTEVRKVVWPTRKETTQTTLIVLVVVIIMSLLLWALDSILAWVVRALTN